MPLKAVVTDIESVDESYRSLYVKHEDKYKLDVVATEGYELDNVAGLKSALAAERSISAGLTGKLKGFDGLDPNSARAAQARLAEFGDIDPVKAREGLTALDKFSKFNPETEAERLAEEKLKNAKAQLKADFIAEKSTLETERDALKTRLTKREEQIKANLVKKAVQSELSKLNPLEEARDALEIMAEHVIRLQEINDEFVPVVVDASGNPRVKLAADYSSVPFTVADLMAEMRDKRAALFKPDSKNGFGTEQMKPSGGPSSFDGPNPFAKATSNLTQQMILMRKDPNLAARLQAEAGA